MYKIGFYEFVLHCIPFLVLITIKPWNNVKYIVAQFRVTIFLLIIKKNNCSLGTKNGRFMLNKLLLTTLYEY